MNFLTLLKVEFVKVKRSKIVPLIFIAPLLVVISGVANISAYFTPEYTNAWAAMFIQSALLYAYYLLPFSMIVVCAMLAGRESQNNGVLKMLSLPVSRNFLSLAKLCVLVFYLFMEIVVFFVVFVIAGMIATQTNDLVEAMPILELIGWCLGIFLTMLPCVAVMWAIIILFDKPLLSVGLNLLLVVPGILFANTSLWVAYPYCYSGYFVTSMMANYSIAGVGTVFLQVPFLVCAIVILAFAIWLSTIRFGKKEMR